MRKLILVVVLLSGLALIVGFYPTYVEEPALNGTGPLAIRLNPSLSAPEYHSPLDWWQTHHMDVVSQGNFRQADCLYCHEPQTSCNNCHQYVGVKAIKPSSRSNNYE